MAIDVKPMNGIIAELLFHFFQFIIWSNMMRALLLTFSLLVFCSNAEVQAQRYFPPLNPQLQWDTLSATTLGWCTEKTPALYEYLERSNTKGYLLLYKGRIVLEKYFGTFTKDSAWYWASAGKTLTSVLIGKAQEEKLLSIEDKTSTYLGSGWTSIPKEKEDLITIKNQLTMTTGLNDEGIDLDCTDDTCLTYLADPGTRWSYHNAPYTLLEEVLTKATGQTLNAFTTTTLKTKIGMTGSWLKLGFNNVYFSTPRSMARFGLMMLNNGIWNKDTIIKDREYYNASITRAQVLNPSYGYLWWLNGQGGYMLPGFQFFFNGNFAKEAPEDAISGVGKNGQFVSFSKEHDLVMIRMGQAPDSLGYVPNFYMSDLWKFTMDVACRATSAEETMFSEAEPLVMHDDMIRFTSLRTDINRIAVYDMNGRSMHMQYNQDPINVAQFPIGVYNVVISSTKGNTNHLIVKK